MAKKNFNYPINSFASVSRLNTQNLFDKNFVEPDTSAIDNFFDETRSLHTLISDPNNIPGQLTNLILLGHVSAVESYFRKIIRKIVNIDEISRKLCENQSITFGAAITHDKEMLPEALMEDYSFASEKRIKEAFKTFLGVKGNPPDSVNEILNQFSKVCQLRHCIVHRFGRLGSKNAIAFGLADHKDYLEKPLNISFNDLQDIFLICHNTVKEINNYLFRKILTRTVEENTVQWTWDLTKDKTAFKKYFVIFASDDSPPTPKPTVISTYNEFKKIFK